jgi:hypothetical protein
MVSPVLALAQSVPRLGRRRGVAILDSALHRSLVTSDGITQAHDLARRQRGVARTHPWWSLADKRAASPLETWGRLDCIDVGVPPDDLQVEIVDGDGEVLGRGDAGWLLDDGRWLIAEFDGAEYHDSLDTIYYDRYRQNRLQAVGNAVVLRFTARDLARPGFVGTQVRDFLRDRRRHAG